MGAAPAQARGTLELRIAQPLGLDTLAVPWTVQARMSSGDNDGFYDPSKPMCFGIELQPEWGNHGDYTGRCRYGAPIMAIAAIARPMDKRLAVGTAQEDGLPQSFGTKLSTELTNIAGLPTLEAKKKRVKRDAKKARRSWASRNGAHCLMYGAGLAGLDALYEFVVHHRVLPDGTAKTAALGCAGAVLTPMANKWLKSKGFDLED
jgi:hypothetical protein